MYIMATFLAVQEKIHVDVLHVLIMNSVQIQKYIIKSTVIG